MDDVQLVKRFAEDRFPPDPTIAERARAQTFDRLQETMRRKPRRRPGLSLTLVAAGVAAIAMVVTLLVPQLLRESEVVPAMQDPKLTARGLLLKAADESDANAKPAGGYWKLQVVDVVGKEVSQRTFWYGPRSSSVVAGPAGDNGANPFMYELDGNVPAIAPGGSLATRQLLDLQDHPAGLKRAIEALWAGHTASPGEVSEEEYFTTLVKLLTTVPVTPEVRAEALRMLAGLPRIRTVGEATDYLGRTGVVVTLAKDEDGFDEWDNNLLTIDPKTFEVLSAKSDAPRNDPTTPYYVRWTMVAEAGWTDEEPHIPARLPVRIR